MKTFWAFVKKETLHILRDPRTLVILLGMPIAQVVLFGFAITNELNDARIAIFDASGDPVTQEISDRLTSSGFFQLAIKLDQEDQLERAFQHDRVKLAVVFPPEFQERFFREDRPQIQLIADATDPNTATTLIAYASAIIRQYEQEKKGSAALPYSIQTEVRMRYNEELKSVYLFVPGVITIILMLVSAMMTSIALTREKELGTMEILLVSPLKPVVIVVGKVIPYIALGLANMAIILILATMVFHMPIRGSLFLLIAESLLFIMTSLALGIMISSRVQTQQVALMISLMVLMLPTILLSGFIFPIENMPWPLQAISHIVPARWFIVIVKGVMLKGAGLAVVWKETLILIVMTLVLIGASVRSFKLRLE
ncbi:MAG: ABC transporter permease [Saprospirales bacterium]|nr:ABC transporter permease [Saprospirales bacterium]